MTRNNGMMLVDQNRIGKAKLTDRCGDLMYLPFRMRSRVSRKWLQAGDKAVFDLKNTEMRYGHAPTPVSRMEWNTSAIPPRLWVNCALVRLPGGPSIADSRPIRAQNH